MDQQTNTVTQNLLDNVRETFHLSLMPQKGVVLAPVQAFFMATTLDTTIARAQIVSRNLECEEDVCGIIGTTPRIIEGLRQFFANPALGDLAMDLRRQQSDFNANIDPRSEAAQAITRCNRSIIPPTNRPSIKGFGC